MNTTTTNLDLNLNLTHEEVLSHITSLVGGIIVDLSQVDVDAFLVGHTIHLFNVDALPFIEGSRDERGVVTLYWVATQTPEELVAHVPCPTGLANADACRRLRLVADRVRASARHGACRAGGSLGVCISIHPTENAPKPRVENASKVFSTLRGVPVSYTQGKRIVGLPPGGIPEDKILITSAITASAAAELGMTNILAPGGQVKALPDANGRSLVVGCFGFMQGS